MAFNVIYNIIANDKFSKSSKKIGKSADRLKGRFAKLKAMSNKLSSGLKKVLVGGALILAFRKMTVEGGKFQDSLADLSAITGAVGKDLEFLKLKAFELSKSAVRSGDEILTAFKLVASAKPELLENTKALASVTEQVLLLANASGMDLTEAANITAQALNIFGKGAEYANKFVNILAAGAKLGSSEIRETGEAMLLAGPAARAAGLDFAQLNAIIQTTAKGGIKAARAGTAINAILGRLRRQGIDFKKLGLEGAFEKVRVALDKVKDPTKRAQLEAKIFGEEHSKVGLAILSNTALLGKYNKSLRGTNIAQEQANIRLSTFNSKSKKLGGTIKEALVKSFLLLEPLLTNIVVLLDFSIRKIGTALDIVLLRPLKVLGTLIGSIVGFATTGFNTEGFKGLGSQLTEIISPTGPKESGSKSTLDVSLNAPEGVIKSIKSKSRGPTKLNVGTNMIPAGA